MELPGDGKPDEHGASKGGAEPPQVPPSLPRPVTDPVVPILRGPGAPEPARRDEGPLPERARQDRWVVRLRAGDEAALREVVDAFGDRITRVVAGILRDRDAVDDVVQESFVKAYYRIASFKGDAGLYTWLYRIAVNAAKDHAKRRSRRPAVALEELPSGAASIPSRDPVALERLEDREDRLAVRRAVESLPPRFRAVLVLREVEGLRYEEIAQILDISLGTVESRLFRARRRLKARLERRGHTS
jgi:RNA polymerase sigma-70 factor (ECF subfamily)